MSAGWPLQQALYGALIADAELTDLLGGAHVYDSVPDEAPFPFVVLGDWHTHDWGTATEEGEEHEVTLHAWSRARGRKETRAILAALQAALHDAGFALAGHHLVNLRVTGTSLAVDPNREAWRGTLRLRAVTEPIV